MNDDVRSFFTFIIFTVFLLLFISNYFLFTCFHIYLLSISIFIYLTLSYKMPVQTRSPRVKTSAISDPENVPLEACLNNEKATSSLSGRVGFDRPLEVSSVNYKNDFYKI